MDDGGDYERMREGTEEGRSEEGMGMGIGKIIDFNLRVLLVYLGEAISRKFSETSKEIGGRRHELCQCK